MGLFDETHEYSYSQLTSFDNGVKINYTLCCGDNNYYDAIVFQYPDGIEEDLDCSYDFDDIEVDAGSDIYRIILELTDK